jgi:hypothetical protein
MKRLLQAPVLAITSAIFLWGCGGVTDPSKNRVDNFPGTLNVLGQNDHFFSVDKNGEVLVKFTSISPNAAAILGVGLGQQANASCAVVSVNQAGLNRDAFSGPIQRGAWCVRVFDNGTLTAAQNYTVQVSHP